ncbi:F0F1 ATP synthase subunit delta [Clostridiaceae bacterium 68-1-5]|uniref:F0F1 ATP synthase subunit delta n=1 Tax=Suipraeoptans intestinalis TaxID=2606628 RepID=A0A6N7UY74_9FIRM|nr:F0F1 ATP synthase subunit delta [Suipraeoptans intestinalis]
MHIRNLSEKKEGRRYEKKWKNFSLCQGALGTGNRRNRSGRHPGDFAGESEAEKVLEDPRVSRQDKSRVVDRVFPEAYKGLLQTLVKYETVALLDDMKTGLQAEKDKRERRITIRLSYVTPPSVQEKDQMEILLKQKFAASEVRWLEEEKPELLGGFLLQVNGWEYDYSTRGRWLELKRGLIRR